MSDFVVTQVSPPRMLNINLAEALDFPPIKRIAVYARVSTDDEDQLNSYAGQVDFYTKLVTQRPDWVLVDVYADEAVTGTSTKKREGFKRMMQDAMDGKIDMIVTKSVSRFARNTVDSLVSIRQLKEKGIEVFFEKENIYTLDSKGELLLTIMSSVAQEESRSISENVTWGMRKRFADGKVSLPYKRFLGYEKGENGRPSIVPEEAAIVQWMYKLFLDGESINGIAAKLVERGVPTPSGKKNWSPSTVESILQNEKYKGEAILQKTITKDFLTKETKINEGEAPMYHVENSHPAIVSPEIHNLVQEEMTRRKQLGIRHYGGSCFSGKVFCGDCGASYGSKLWHSTSKYRRTIWQCNHKFRGEKKCGTPHLNENDLRKAFVEVINRRLRQKDEIIGAYEVIFAQLADCSELDQEEQKALRKQDEVRAQMKRLIEQNAQNAQNQAEYNQQYNGLKARLDSVHAKIIRIADQRIARQAQQQRLSDVMGELRARDALLTGFDEGLFNATVDRITIGSDGAMVFRFKDRTEERYTA